MKILILTNHQMGLYKFRRELIEKLVNGGHKVYVSVPEGEFTNTLQDLGTRVVINRYLDRRGTNPITDLKLLNYWKAILKKVKPDVVLTYTIKPNIYGGYLCGRLGIPYVTNVTGLGTSLESDGIKQKFISSMYRVGLKKAQMIFFQNEENKRFMLKRNIVSSSYDVLPGSGVNTKEHNFEPYPDEGEGIIISYIGRIMKDKGIDELIEAAKIIHIKHDNVKLRLIGFFEDDYDAVIHEADKDGIIEYISQQTDIHPWIAESHAIIMPSYHEGMNNVILEAASTGRPVLASDIPGCREAVDDRKSGLLFEAKSSAAIVSVIDEFLSLSHEKKAFMGKAGREKMAREFDRKIVVDRYIRELRKIEDR